MGQTPNFDPRDYGNEINDCKNGSLDFWQRVVSNNTIVNTASSVEAYTADRFSHSSSGTTVKNYSAQSGADFPTFSQALFQASQCYRFDVLTAIPSPAAGDRVLMFKYRMEGNDYRPYHGKKMFVGLWIKSPISGGLPFTFTKFLPTATFESYVTPIVIDPTEINLWVWKVVEVTLTTTTPNSFTNSHALQMHLGGAIGSSFLATQNTWTSGEKHSFAGAANMFSAVQTFRFALMKISHSYPSPYFVRHELTYEAELAAVQRYYEKSFPIGTVPGSVTGISGGPNFIAIGGVESEGCAPFKVQKRASPVIVTYGNNGVAGQVHRRTVGDLNATPIEWNEWGISRIDGSWAAGNAIGFHFTADAEL